MRPIGIVALACAAFAQTGDVRTFMGRKVTIAMLETGATLCLGGPPAQQCYTAKGFRTSPHATLLRLDADHSAIFFTAEANAGGSGYTIRCALLRPGYGKELEDALPGISLSNLSEHTFWTEPSFSPAPLFITADWVAGPNEAHYSYHRYMISAYAYRKDVLLDEPSFVLEDRYMTAHSYPSQDDPHILTSERNEILARLERIRQQRLAR